MAAPQASPALLSPEAAGRLAEFAKACKAATRIVSMYPATHPAIQSAFARIGEATKQATIHGYYTSEIGIHQELKYKGNKVLLEFVGCQTVDGKDCPYCGQKAGA